MKRSPSRLAAIAVLTFATLVLSDSGSAASVTAANCSQSAVQSAINNALDGDLVAVPAGNCTWSTSVALSKGIHLRGAGAGQTVVTVGQTFRITKHPTRSIELSGFTFNAVGTSNETKMIVVTGTWSAKPPLIHDNVFNSNGAAIMRYEANGGVIYRNQFNGVWDSEGIQHKIASDSSSWSTADSLGTRDTLGTMNLYVEDNTFTSMSNQGTDFDDAARVVWRYNTHINTSVNSHGLDTSPIGVRHYEIYGNNFLYPSNMVNQGWWIWLRGGTGVVFNNTFQDITGQMWGNKAELLFSVRMADDGGVLGCATSWPAPHQVGQNHTGTAQFTDGVHFWGNTGTYTWQIQRFGNSCGQDITKYLQNGRDFTFDAVPKTGYTPYSYPHPLRGGGTTTPPRPVTNVRVVR